MSSRLRVIDTTSTTFPSARDYTQYDHRTHVYKKPDTYIGSDERVQREEWIFNLAEKKMVNTTLDFTPGCERLFLEILTNASDNVGRSRRANVDPGKIEIKMDRETIIVTNYGLPIPIEIHPTEKIYVPKMIFGSLLSSSNYDKDRHEAGTNGIGAKAANIFSSYFSVRVFDHIRHLSYFQEWSDNMQVVSEHQIEEYPGETSSTTITYKMDFARFSYPLPKDGGGYPDEAFMLFARHAADISFTAKTSVSFNGETFNYSEIREYARLYFGESVNNAIVHYQWPAGTEVKQKKKGYQVAINPAIVPEVELIAIDTPDEGSQISFVNCMMTRDGGVHVNAAIKAVGETTVSLVNENVIKKLTKNNKGKEIDVKQKRAHTININDVKPHISILLSCRVLNPKFASQTKTSLQAPVPKISIKEEELKALTKWQLMDRLLAALEAKQFASMSKTDGKFRRYVQLEKGIDANQAGKTGRANCVLYITEGRSGAGYANKIVDLVPGGRDYVGVLPMRGKSLNVMKASRLQLEANKEINELKKMLGLCEGVDYRDDAAFNKLRYGGGILVMADSDVDGKHIKGLIINFFHCRFPSLLIRGYVMLYITPIVRVFHGKRVLKFFEEEEYEKWCRETPDYQKWTHKYFKGLGTSKDEHIEDDHSDPQIVTCFYDENAPEFMRLAFHPNFSNARKTWIASYDALRRHSFRQVQPISDFINEELILFSIADVRRSIPSLMDGMKEAHRKIIHGTHLKWSIGSQKKEYAEFKVAQFSAFIADRVKYHHGEQVLDKVIVGMTQDFIGANNIPLFTQDGQFGTRFDGGKDAAETRYSYTRPTSLFHLILRHEDQPILKHISDEGCDIEPETYYPIIPMILVNGCQGIGTGHSTFVPNHNPLDIIKWLRNRLEGVGSNDNVIVNPWYRGFKGEIKLIDRSRRGKLGAARDFQEHRNSVLALSSQDEDLEQMVLDEALNQEEEEEMLDSIEQLELLSMITTGIYEIRQNGMIVITELPIGRTPKQYHKWLEVLVVSKKISGFRDLSGRDKIYFEIYDFVGEVNIRSLKLQRSYGMSNMVLLNNNLRPTHYGNTYDILETFFTERLPIYQVRKDYILNKLQSDISILHDRIKFIRAVIDGKLEIRNRKKADIREDMDRLEIPREIYDSVKVTHLSEDDILSLQKKISDKEEEFQLLFKKSPEELWSAELEELEVGYRKHYKLEKRLRLLK